MSAADKFTLAVKEAIRLGNKSDPIDYRSALIAIGRAAVELHEANNAQPAHKPTDERAAFEAWIAKDCGDLSKFGTGQNTHYKNSAVNNAWTGWKARAGIATYEAEKAQPAQDPAVKAELPTAEQIAHAKTIPSDKQTPFDAACEILGHLRSIGATYYYTHRMQQVIQALPGPAAASHVPVQPTAAQAQPAPEPTNERAAFENWAADQAAITSEPDCWARHRFGGDYVYQKVEMAWRAWRDGRAAGRADAQPADTPAAPTREALADVIAAGLSGTWHCTRVWQAWGVGTMSQDDFEPVDESDTPGEIADAILAMLAARAEKGGT